ncbi:MAG: OsmC family protein [Chloroflexota bacterium]
MTDKWTKLTAVWKGGMDFIGYNEAGGQVQMTTINGVPGVGPMQLLLAGLAGCTGMDIVSILQKKKINLTDFKVEVEGLRADTYPMIWTDINIMYLLWGESIKMRDVEQAIKLSEDKYCSASIMLGKSARIKSGYKILKPGETTETRSD